MKKAAVIMLSTLLATAGCSHKEVKVEESRADQGFAPRAETIDLNMVHFAFNRSELTPQARKNLDKDVLALQNDPQLKFQIQGFCDARGTVQYNLELGQRRAAAVSGYLEKQGINPGRVSIVSLGKSHPIDSGKSEKAYAMNRRASFVLGNDPEKVASR